MEPVRIKQGASPLILSAPHAGAFVPPEIEAHLNETGKALADTDWHVDRLYEGLAPNATFIKANFHRYVIDANRPPDDEDLYPGQNTTGLVPFTDFDGEPIWRDGSAPDDAEIARRREKYHAPYHRAITEAVDNAKAFYGVAVLYDCHSIRSNIPYLFEGELPALNIGTNNGNSCSRAVESIVATACSDSDFSSVLNARFKGGWTTRHYGAPALRVHAIQMEIAQRAYMNETPPWTYDNQKADKLRPLLRNLLAAVEHAALEGEL